MLLLANALAGNLWLGQINTLRLDATRGNQYSISPATEGYHSQLQEPLLVRGYFSAKTHPLLAPLVPQLRDLVKEYEVSGAGKVRVEFVDPAHDPEMEQEANQRYGIQPVPFQVADRYQSSIVSSYFNVLIQYGDQYEVLSFNDLIEIKAQSETDVDVQLRNPEHDLTRALKNVIDLGITHPFLDQELGAIAHGAKQLHCFLRDQGDNLACLDLGHGGLQLVFLLGIEECTGLHGQQPTGL